jgi:dihydrofolate reductase
VKKARVSIIAAVGRNRELGKKNELIWRISPDLKRFKALTTGHPIIMGRKTYESIGKPLPDRTNIVVTRGEMEIPGCILAHSFEEALGVAREKDAEEIFIIGGAQLYTETISDADRLCLTLIDEEDTDADVFFPDYAEFKNVLEREDHPEHTPPYSWLTLER